MKHFKLTIAYDGRAYHGWQAQKHQDNINPVRTVQGEINAALHKFTRTDVETFGASRTDAGVHAKGQTLNFSLDTDMPAEKIQFTLNRMLDDDVQVVAITEVDAEFHSRFSAKGKRYRYRMGDINTLSPFDRHYTAAVKKVTNLAAMQEAAALYVGEHDFAAFGCKSDNVPLTTTRTMYRSEIIDCTTHWEFVVEGTAFLYKMVRNMVGALIAVGQNRLTPADIQAMLETQERNPKFSVADANGLCLEEVFYD